MSEGDRFKYRQHFLAKHIVEYADSLYKVMPVFFKNESTAFNVNSSTYISKGKEDTYIPESSFSNAHLLQKLIEWLKNSTGENFISFCLLLADCGQYCLFSALLSYHTVDCSELQRTSKLLNLPNCQRIKNFTEALKRNPKFSFDCKQPMLDSQRFFLQKHEETLRMRITSLDDILNYLLYSRVLSCEQFLLVKASAIDKKVSRMVEFLTAADATSDSYQRLCHALLLTSQFALFNILHDLSDLKRLELFYQEYNPLMLENDENQQNIIHFQVKDASFLHHEEQEIEENIPMPSGVLENLRVDRPDTNFASQLSYYSTAALQEDVYRNFSKPKGLALIINNYKFQQHIPFIRNRDGTEVDKKNIANLLTQLGYQVLPALVDLSASEMLQAAFDFAVDPRHDQADSCVIVVLTHGEYDYFTGVDGNKVNLHRFLSSMNSRNAPKLAGKPKIFIMQACRGEIHDQGVKRYVPIEKTDSLFDFHFKQQSQCQSVIIENVHKGSSVDHSSFSLFSCIGLKSSAPSTAIPSQTSISEPFPSLNSSPSSSTQSVSSSSRLSQPFCGQSPAKERVKEPLPKTAEPDPKLYKVIKEPSDADMLIAYATTPNYVSWRNSMNGTWFVQSICEVFSKHAANEDIVTMLTRVNKQVAQVYESSSSGAKQIPEMASRLRKKFYFFPGINSK